MKTYVLTISEFFPKTHNKSGLPTGFINAISNKSKKHTVRGNYELWQKRFEQINEGKACLSIRYWTGKPYNSKQQEVFNLTNIDGIGVEKLEFEEMIMTCKEVITTKSKVDFHIWAVKNLELNELSKNDGLDLGDFKEWFKKYDLSKPMAIIHFTAFRYYKEFTSVLTRDKEKIFLGDYVDTVQGTTFKVIKLKTIDGVKYALHDGGRPYDLEPYMSPNLWLAEKK